MSSTIHHAQEPSPPRRKRRLDPNLKRRETERGITTSLRFDRMIETMSGSPRSSHRNKRRSGRTYSHIEDAYTLPSPEHLKNSLSFVKMDPVLSSPLLNAQRSSDTAQVSARSCDPLPEWLANTFRSLTKKHPLRLLLPLNLAQDFPGEPRSTDETDGQLPLVGNNSDVGYNHSQSISYTNCAMDTSVVSDSDSPEPLPYSTPGPTSRLGGISVAAKTTLSAGSLQTSSSPTLFNIDGHLPLHKQSHQSINHPTSITSTAFRYCDGLFSGELDSDPDPLLLADNPYLSEIYATPGPTYRGPSIQSDSPTEDRLTLESESTPSQLPTDDNHLHFRWRPFDRKTVVAPVLSKAPAFASGGKRSTTKTNSGNSPPLATSHAVQPPISPSPFSFSPLDRTPPAESAFDPQSHETPPLQIPSTFVPAIYSQPLSVPPGWTPGSLSLVATGMLSKDKELPEGEQYAVSEDSFTDDHKLGSKRSLDGVEFWDN